MSPSATATLPARDRLLQLTERLQASPGTHRAVRDRFGVPPDDGALRAVAWVFQPPAWATGYIGAFDAQFLYDMVACTRPRRMIEIGVASGVSTAVLLRALADIGPVADDAGPRLHSFDILPKCYFDDSRATGAAVDDMTPEFRHGVQMHLGKTAVDAARLFAADPVDLAFIDGDHRHPCPIVDLLTLLPALKPGAWVILHDIDLPAAALRYEAMFNTKVDWHHAGAQRLYDHWPWEKFRGEGDGRNIGAVRIPADHAVTRDDFRALIDLPWEVKPDTRSRRILGRE